jgi:hypothetical protein
MTPRFKLQLLAMMKGFLVSSHLKSIHDHPAHQGHGYVKNWRSVQGTETVIEGSKYSSYCMYSYGIHKLYVFNTVFLCVSCDCCINQQLTRQTSLTVLGLVGIEAQWVFWKKFWI